VVQRARVRAGVRDPAGGIVHAGGVGRGRGVCVSVRQSALRPAGHRPQPRGHASERPDAGGRRDPPGPPAGAALGARVRGVPRPRRLDGLDAGAAVPASDTVRRHGSGIRPRPRLLCLHAAYRDRRARDPDGARHGVAARLRRAVRAARRRRGLSPDRDDRAVSSAAPGAADRRDVRADRAADLLRAVAGHAVLDDRSAVRRELRRSARQAHGPAHRGRGRDPGRGPGARRVAQQAPGTHRAARGRELFRGLAAGRLCLSRHRAEVRGRAQRALERDAAAAPSHRRHAPCLGPRSRAGARSLR